MADTDVKIVENKSVRYEIARTSDQCTRKIIVEILQKVLHFILSACISEFLAENTLK